MNDKKLDGRLPPNPFGEISESQDAVANICRLPVDFKTLRTFSVIDLVQRSGIINEPQALSYDSIIKYLRDHSELIEAWLIHSDDQRCSPSWYFYRGYKTEEEGKWVVGFSPDTGHFEDGERLFFEDPFEACANFIIRYVNRTPAMRSPQHPHHD
ncbi:MAG: hypothetical protein HZB51_19515 [Chloroflexi bacterium]|nr:hypothetical protein [Chloroflexota bacterium]